MRKLQNSELNRLSISAFKEVEKLPILVILDNVRSLNNIGSFFRTGDAFLISGIYLCGISATPPNKDIHKTALGATESVDWRYFEDSITAIKTAREAGYRIISIEQTEDSVALLDFEVKLDEKYALVFGHEVKGVDQQVVDLSDWCIEIPQHGTKHSFNVSVSAGIVLWDFYQKIKKAD